MKIHTSLEMVDDRSVSDASDELEDIVLIDEVQYTAQQEARRRGGGLFSWFSKRPDGFQPIQDHDDDEHVQEERPQGKQLKL